MTKTNLELPTTNSIDLNLHDLPHLNASLEWWYVNTHLTLENGSQISLFAAFFRAAASIEFAKERADNYFLTWAITDVESNRYLPTSLLDPRSVDEAMAELEAGRGGSDYYLNQALREVLMREQLPLPDKLMQKPAEVALDRLNLNYDGNSFVCEAPGQYRLLLNNQDEDNGCNLLLTLEKPIVLHGDNGIVRGLSGLDMFYYFCPRCKVTGTVTIDNVEHAVSSGSGWYDHEFGEHGEEREQHDGKVAWNWIAAQLDNGWEVTAYDIFDRKDANKSYGRWAVVIDPAGNSQTWSDFEFQPLDSWRSIKTFNSYPIRYRLVIPEANIDLMVEAQIPQQEVVTLLSPPGFWEGRVKVSGQFMDVETNGLGFVERSGVNEVDTIDGFLRSVSLETQKAINNFIPAIPSQEDALRLIAIPDKEYYTEAVSLEQWTDTLVTPIREILLRGGKAWRSYAFLASIEVVGGNPEPYRHWLALPELLHVGSLIIDDVQDKSEIRRGGLACHRIYGDALAINAGCASYFLAQAALLNTNLPASLMQRIYELYFAAVRAAHTGQALDIDGLRRFVPQALETENSLSLEQRVYAIHRLKSAIPPAVLARVGALIGGATEEQALAVGNLLEAYGLAFQIVDDVLNLRGFQDKRKTTAEDLTEGKITAPVAKAFRLLSPKARTKLWQKIELNPQSQEEIEDIVHILNDCGALEKCMLDARDIVETAWSGFNPLIPDSVTKLRLRAFGWFVLDRHY